MEMTMRLPSNYNILSEEEMTYTNGGSDTAEVIGSIIGIGIVGWYVYNYVDCIIMARHWYKENKGANIGTAVSAFGDFMTSSAGNFFRGVCAVTANLGILPLFVSAAVILTA